MRLKKLEKCIPTKTDTDLYKWAKLINAESEEEYAMLEKDPYIEEALKEIEKLSRDPEKVKEYEWRDRCLRDYVSFKNAAIQEGLEEGIEKGIKKGIEKGIEKGEIIKLIEIINKKLSKNMSVADISALLEEDVSFVGKIVDKVKENPTFDSQKIFEQL